MSADRADVVARFHALRLADSLLQVLELRIGAAECRMTFDVGAILDAPGARFSPALLVLHGVRSFACEGGRYELNSTVVDFGAVVLDDGLVELTFDLTGGRTQEGFMAKLRVVAESFSFGPREGA